MLILSILAKEEDEDDPFDTSAIKTPEAEKEEEEELPVPEDPFDLSHVRTPEPEYQPDLLTSLGIVSNKVSRVTIFVHKF